MSLELFSYGLVAVCAVLVFFGPIRIAIIALVVSAHINLGVGEHVAGGVAFLNAGKIVLLPLTLWLRLYISANPQSIRYGAGFYLWVTLVAYAAISATWLDVESYITFAKQAGYLLIYALLYAIFVRGFAGQYIKRNFVTTSITIALVLALLQTYYFGNPFGDTQHWQRLVSFTAKQQYAEFLVAFLVLGLGAASLKWRLNWFWIPFVVLQLILNGSRTGIAAAGMATAIVVIHRIFVGTAAERGRLILSMAAILVLTAIMLMASSEHIVSSLEQSRLAEATTAVAKRDIEAVGSFGDRIKIWSIVLERISDFSLREHVFGRGLTSGVEILEGPDTGRGATSSNRIFHNEYLRIYFELGIVGSILMLAVLSSVCFLGLRLLQTNSDPTLIAYLPGLVSFLAIENVLAASGSAGGMSISIVLAYSAVRYSNIQQAGNGGSQRAHRRVRPERSSDLLNSGRSPSILQDNVKRC